MTRCIPESPTFVTGSEKAVWTRLRDTLGADCVLLANQRLTNEDKDFEADLVVLIPDVGICVLEVKGGSIWHDETGWHQMRRGKEVSVQPVDQVREVKYALRPVRRVRPALGSASPRRLGARPGDATLDVRLGLRGARAAPVGAPRRE